MVIRNQTMAPLEIVCDVMLISQVIFESMRVADDSFRGTLSVNGLKRKNMIS